MLKLTKTDIALHETAKRLSRALDDAEFDVINVIIEVDRTKLFLKYGIPSLFKYVVSEMNKIESVANSLIGVARKAAVIPALRQILSKGRLTPSKAARMISVLTPENANELIEFAIHHSAREIDKKAGELSGRKRKRASKKFNEDGIRYGIELTHEENAIVEHAMRLVSAKTGGKEDAAATFVEGCKRIVELLDPLKKAQRSQKRKAPPKTQEADGELCTSRVKPKRTPTPAATSHALWTRDEAQCTELTLKGERCTETKWLHEHHIVAVADGGSNELENLRLVCPVHHALIHQLNFDIDYVLKEPEVEYRTH